MHARRLAWSLWAIAVVLAAGSVSLLIVSWTTPPPAGTFGFRGFAAIFALAFGTVGALIASRQPRNPIGWLMLASSVVSGVQEFAFEYGIWAVLGHHPSLALGEAAAWVPAWIWIPGTSAAMFILLLFPQGRLLSERWRWAVAIGIAGMLLSGVGFAVVPGPLENFANVENPFGVGTRDTTIIVAMVGQTLYGLAFVLAAVSVGLRFRRSTGEERQQMKWLVASAAFLVFTLVSSFVGQFGNAATGASVSFGVSLLVITGFSSLPIAMGFAILKYRLYDLDVVIRKTVVFGILVVLLMMLATAAAITLGWVLAEPLYENPPWFLFTGFAFGLLTAPLYRLSTRLADRLVFGGRRTSYEVMTEFSERMANAYAADDILPRLARVAAEGVGAASATVWIEIAGRMRSAASWPAQAERLSALDGALEIRHQGELLGALSVEMPANDPMTPAREQILRDLAAQAGLALRNVRLLEDVRESRRRIVTAQDERARKLERDLHDGAQQQLVALTVKARLVAQLAERDPKRVTALLEEFQSDASDALENLRDLARGIYPPLLAEAGLAAALEAQARKAAVPVVIAAGDVGRLPSDVESAVYFSVLEALNNVAKYADASQATVSLTNSSGVLRFEVMDDGRGFAPEARSYGTGLQGIADRLAALGGELDVQSTPGAGTIVGGILPMKGPS